MWRESFQQFFFTFALSKWTWSYFKYIKHIPADDPKAIPLDVCSQEIKNRTKFHYVFLIVLYHQPWSSQYVECLGIGWKWDYNNFVLSSFFLWYITSSWMIIFFIHILFALNSQRSLWKAFLWKKKSITKFKNKNFFAHIL